MLSRGCGVRVFGTGSVEDHSEPSDREFSWRTIRENGCSVEWTTHASEGRGYCYLSFVFLFSATHRSVSNISCAHQSLFSDLHEHIIHLDRVVDYRYSLI